MALPGRKGADARMVWMLSVAVHTLCALQVCLAKSPHILFIVMDDLGSHDLGIHGTGIHTPHCDQLVRDGLYLSNYYVLPSCSPTRTALLSGRYPLHTGVYNWIPSRTTIGLPLEDETVAQVLGRGGYQRHAVGKWHAGHSSWEQTPTFRGFDSFLGYWMGHEDYFSHVADGAYDLRYDRKEFCGAGCSEVVDERGNYSSHVFADASVRVIEDYDANKGPLFLYLAFQAVHAPDQVPEKYRRPYEGQNWTEARKTYAGMLTAADEGVGKVVAALKAKGLWGETLVLFTTDNGGPTETCAVTGASNYPLRGGKCTVWEGGTRGDGFVSGPAAKRLGLLQGISQQLFHVVDWLPTLAAIARVSPQGQHLDGVDQLEALRGGSPAREEAFIGVSDMAAGGEFGPALRYRQWKLIRGSGGPSRWVGPEGSDPRGNLSMVSVEGDGGGSDALLLFDLSADPREQTNLAGQHPDVVRQLAAKLQAYQASGVPPQQSDPACPWTNRSLEPSPAGLAWAPWCARASRVVLYT